LFAHVPSGKNRDDVQVLVLRAGFPMADLAAMKRA
jgi:hypothetical protein